MKKILFLLIFFICSIYLFPQIAISNIYGTVMLPDGSAIPGVNVSLTGEIIGKITTTTSMKGNFRILKLSPGKYDLTCELSGFKTVIRKNIRIYVGKNITLNVQMETTTQHEEIIITEKPGIIDVRKTEVGINVTTKMIKSLPTARNPWTLMNLVPGIMLDREDVGGNESGQQSIFYGHGSDNQDTTWNIDGANIGETRQVTATMGGFAMPAVLNVNAYEELRVTLGSNDMSYQTGGVQLNFVTKRGRNRFSGDFHLYVEDKAWEVSQELPEYYKEKGFVFPGINRLYQYGINIGGPIIRNKWWWFGSWAIQDIHARTEHNTEDATWLVSAYAKTHFQLGNTSGEFTYTYSNNQKGGRTRFAPTLHDEGNVWDQRNPGNIYLFQLQQVWSNLMLNAKLVYSPSTQELDPRRSDIDEEGHNTGSDWLYYHTPTYHAGSDGYYNAERKTINLSLDANYYAEDLLGGDHEIRFGVDYNHGNATSTFMYPNQRIVFIYLQAAPSVYQSVWFLPDQYSEITFSRFSLYLSDTATFKKFTINAGLRFDRESAGFNQHTLRAFTWYEPGSPHHGEILFPEYLSDLTVQAGQTPQKYRVWSPRISLSYDLKGDGKTLFKLSAARYGSKAGELLATRYSCRWREIDVIWMDDGDLIPEYEELVLGDQSLDYATWKNITTIDYETGWQKNDTDPGFNSPLLDELSLGIEKALGEDIAISLFGFYKRRHNLVRQIGILADGLLETEAENWYNAGDFTFETGEIVPFYLRHETPTRVYYTNYDNDSYEQYLALQLTFTKKFSRKWMLDASFTYADWKAFWNREEYGNGDLTNYDYFNGGSVVRYSGKATAGGGLSNLIVNARWMFKLSGLVQLPWGINLTTVLTAREGYILPYYESYYREGGIGWTYMYKPDEKLGDHRLPAFWMLNLGLEKSFNISDTATATLFINTYNATNNATTLQVETNYTAENFNEPVRLLNPGIFQFGFRLSF